MLAMVVYVFISHIAITCHMTLVQKFGGVAAVLVGNFRKALTICLSFMLFPKPLSIWYLVGGACVFGGLLAQEYTREVRKQQKGSLKTSTGKWEKTSDGSHDNEEYEPLNITDVRADQKKENVERRL